MWLVLLKRRFVVTRFGLSFGIKICALLSVFIIYQLGQETSLETTRLLPRIIQTMDNEKNYKMNHYKMMDPGSLGSECCYHSFNSKKVSEDDAEDEKRLRFLFVLHHYEQITKTTQNLIYLAAVAKEMNRVIIEPFVRDSRMCGLPSGWLGAPRKERRKFYPLSLYYDVEFMNDLLKKSGIATMRKLELFKQNCRSGEENTTLLHFMFNDQSREDMQKWYKISPLTYQRVKENILQSGWCDCSFIDGGLNVTNRIGNLTPGRQICVDAERVKSIKLFKDEIIKDDKCVVIIHWRGFGRDRSYFKLETSLNDRKLVHSLRLSKHVLRQAKTITEAIGGEYISIHIRSERQILWYDVARLSQCLETLIEKATNLTKTTGINKVFVSSDMTRHGSDTLRSLTAQNSTLAHKMKQLKRLVSKRLNAIKYNPKSNDPLNMDSGVIALTQMNVLIGGSHLLTLGSGTFQQRIVDGFVERKSGNKRVNNWTITRICNKESKVNSYKPR